MKNAEPKVVVPIAIVVIVVCLFFVIRSLGVGQSSTAPPISTGMPSDLGKKPGSAASIAIPGGAPGSAPGMAPGMGGTALSTPGASSGGNMQPMPGAPSGK